MLKFNFEVEEECVRNEFIMEVADVLGCNIKMPGLKLATKMLGKLQRKQELSKEEQEKLDKEINKYLEENDNNWNKYMNDISIWLIENGYMEIG